MSGYDIEQLIETALGWEISARDLYVGFAEAFAAHPPVHELWNAMAADEARHASALIEARDELDADGLAVGVDADTVRLIASVDMAFAEAREARIASLDDAYEVAHQIENSEMGTIFRLLTIEAVSDRAKRELLEIQLDEHVSRLESFGRSTRAEHRRSILPAS